MEEAVGVDACVCPPFLCFPSPPLVVLCFPPLTHPMYTLFLHQHKKSHMYTFSIDSVCFIIKKMPTHVPPPRLSPHTHTIV